jgi:hypothetical protein
MEIALPVLNNVPITVLLNAGPPPISPGGTPSGSLGSKPKASTLTDPQPSQNRAPRCRMRLGVRGYQRAIWSAFPGSRTS